MKTLNSRKKSQKFEVFTNSKTGEYEGFAGNVAVYDSEIYIDTRTGKGYDIVVKKLRPLVCKFALKFHFNGNAFEDTCQDVVVHILEGIPRYDPRKEMKLSSFIQMRVARRLINDLRNKSRPSRNATFLNVGTYSVTCECGLSFIDTVGYTDAMYCPECGKMINDSNRMPVNMFEVNESMLNCPEESFDTDTYINTQETAINKHPAPIDSEVIKMCDLHKWLENEDPRVVKIVELIYFHDYSISAAAKEVGLTSAGANIKLKDLRNKKIVRELFGR